ncbi:STAS domain-containing protein [Actinoplanes sp. NPDC051494]|uniref:STAS domain-containing protein n=1 Tax=Actinoplanes sp. NPDC051494 TaxID=3363907 RepID=UPI0037BCB3FE
MSNTAVDVRTDHDGSIVVQPHGAMDLDCAVHFRQILVHTVRRVRPLRLILDLTDVPDMDPINLGTLAALCDLADDHQVAVFMEHSSATMATQLTAAGVPPQRLRPRPSHPLVTVRSETPAAASMSNRS